LTPATGTRPATGSFQIAVVTRRPNQSTTRGVPTFTETTRPGRPPLASDTPTSGAVIATLSSITNR
jgi:hypothetical protein